MMTLNDYQRQAMTTCLPESDNFAYMMLNLAAEVGEIAGSLEAALRANSDADRYNVSTAERKRIADALRSSYMSEHRDHKEPTRQLDLYDDL